MNKFSRSWRKSSPLYYDLYQPPSSHRRGWLEFKDDEKIKNRVLYTNNIRIEYNDAKRPEVVELSFFKPIVVCVSLSSCQFGKRPRRISNHKISFLNFFLFFLLTTRKFKKLFQIFMSLTPNTYFPIIIIILFLWIRKKWIIIADLFLGKNFFHLFVHILLPPVFPSSIRACI